MPMRTLVTIRPRQLRYRPCTPQRATRRPGPILSAHSNRKGRGMRLYTGRLYDHRHGSFGLFVGAVTTILLQYYFHIYPPLEGGALIWIDNDVLNLCAAEVPSRHSSYHLVAWNIIAVPIPMRVRLGLELEQSAQAQAHSQSARVKSTAPASLEVCRHKYPAARIRFYVPFDLYHHNANAIYFIFAPCLLLRVPLTLFW